jgi:DNA-binding transcriptional LysR family regulator
MRRLPGHGIALVRTVISHDAIAKGELVRLSDVELPFVGACHYVFSSSASGKSDVIAAFGAWLAA